MSKFEPAELANALREIASEKSIELTEHAISVLEEAAKRLAEPIGETMEDNVRILLDRCPYTVRSREGGGPEDLIGSLCITFIGMQSRLEGHPMFAKKK